MNQIIQHIIAITLVAASAVYVLHRVRVAVAGRRSQCGGCSGCGDRVDGDSEVANLIPVDELIRSVKR